jgi:O-antigen/teichoic acid export membrane protein
LKGRERPEASVARLERSFLSLATGEGLARGAAFAATVYLARVLGADGYGVVALAAALTLYPAKLADFGISILGSREVAEDPERARGLASALLTGRFVVSCAAAAAMTALAGSLLSPREALVFAGYALTLLVGSLNATWILIGLEDTRPAAAARIAGALLLLGATLLLVRDASQVARAPLGVLVGEFSTVALLLGAASRRGFRIRPGWDARAVPVFRRALPLLGHELLGLAIYNADLVLVRLFHGSVSVGNYAAAYALVTLLVNGAVLYGQSLVAALARLRASGGDALLLPTAAARVLTVALPAAVGGALLAPRITATFFGARYTEAPLALGILLLAVPLAALRSVATAGLVAANAGGTLLRITASAAVLVVALGLVLIPPLGTAGAALAAAATEAVHASWSLRAARLLGLPVLAPGRLRAPGLAAALMAAAVLPLRGGPLWLSVPLGLLVYGGVLALGGALRLRGGVPTLRV